MRERSERNGDDASLRASVSLVRQKRTLVPARIWPAGKVYPPGLIDRLKTYKATKSGGEKRLTEGRQSNGQPHTTLFYGNKVMLAPILRTSLLAPPVQPQFVRVNHAASLLGVSVQTIRNYADNPANGVEVRRTPGNHRLVDLGALAECSVLTSVGPTRSESRASAEEIRQGKISVCYSRVSTRSQCVDKNLDRQAQRLRDYVAANHAGEACVDVSEQASGINSERKGLTKIST